MVIRARPQREQSGGHPGDSAGAVTQFGALSPLHTAKRNAGSPIYPATGATWDAAGSEGDGPDNGRESLQKVKIGAVQGKPWRIRVTEALKRGEVSGTEVFTQPFAPSTAEDAVEQIRSRCRINGSYVLWVTYKRN